MAGVQLLDLMLHENRRIAIWEFARSGWMDVPEGLRRKVRAEIPAGWQLSVREDGRGCRRFSVGQMKLMSKTVLHADDTRSVRRWVAEQLGELDLKVISVADGEAALKFLREVAVRPVAD